MRILKGPWPWSMMYVHQCMLFLGGEIVSLSLENILRKMDGLWIIAFPCDFRAE
jgi:hypothetical protein